MKRALTAAVIGGLMTFFIPQAAFADHNADHHGGESAEHTEKSDEPEQQAPEPERHGDHEHHGDSEGGFLLF